MCERWQEALMCWDSWQDSVKQARNELLTKYDGITSLRSHTREDNEFLGDLLDEISDIYERVIAKDVRFEPDSIYYEDFLYTWMHDVIPELIAEYNPEWEWEDASQKKQLDIWQSSIANKKGRGYEVIHSVNWKAGKVKLGDVLTKIQSMEWPSAEHVKLFARGGKPSTEYRTALEAITCAILKDKQHFTHIEIGVFFGWEIQQNEYEKPKSSQTSYNRVKQGRKILANPA
jgi:hypothetical protein